MREEQPAAKLTVIEWNYRLREILTLKGFTLAGAEDFLEHAGRYDRIVMNPPFEKGQDIEHVRHAYWFLNPGGRVVAIMSAGPFYRQDRKASEFRSWLRDVGGVDEELPAGSFTGTEAERQTGVSTRLVIIDKPREQ